MKTSNLFKLKDRISEIMDFYHDKIITFEVNDEKVIDINTIIENKKIKIFSLILEDCITNSFTIYENFNKEKTNFTITDNSLINNLINCRFELIDVFHSSDTILFYGSKINEKGHYINNVVVKITNISGFILT